MCIVEFSWDNTRNRLFVGTESKLTFLAFVRGLLDLVVSIIDNYVVPLDLI